MEEDILRRIGTIARALDSIAMLSLRRLNLIAVSICI